MTRAFNFFPRDLLSQITAKIVAAFENGNRLTLCRKTSEGVLERTQEGWKPLKYQCDITAVIV
ncbi:hypothetical protein D3C79_632530 [compost metagenome]